MESLASHGLSDLLCSDDDADLHKYLADLQGAGGTIFKPKQVTETQNWPNHMSSGFFPTDGEAQDNPGLVALGHREYDALADMAHNWNGHSMDLSSLTPANRSQAKTVARGH